MEEKKVLSTDKYNSKSQIYDDLVSEGIEWIQKFSGDQWTDYNYHDPGITILEQFCFAITDLGYKCNFSIEDILMIGVDNFDFKKNNLFYPPDEVFRSSPSTINDLRKLIIDSVDDVNNVWVDLFSNSDINLKGLFSLKLQLVDNLSIKEIEKIITQTKKIVMQNRTLCSDLVDITILEKKTIGFSADIIIDSFYVAEEILAKIMFNIENKLNEKVKFVGYEYFDDNIVNKAEVLSGVKTNNGIILDKNLKDKTNQIFVSEIFEIINKVEGVNKVKNFQIYADGIKIYDDIILFSNNTYPSLESVDNLFSKDQLYEINFFRNESLYRVDRLIFSQIYDTLVTEQNEVILSTIPPKNEIKGRFDFKSLIKYYSIINEFPSIYGLRDRELDPKSSKSRIAKMKQLKAFLLIFDQILANHLSQLANIRNLFSVNDLQRTFFNQVPSDVTNIEELLKSKSIKDFKRKLNLSVEDTKNFIIKKNIFIDHMLSRFGEKFNTELIKNIDLIENISGEDFHAEITALKAKVSYANNLLKLGQSRNKASNYFNKNKNLSGLEKRLKILLNINGESSDQYVDFFDQNFKIVEKNIWTNKDILLSKSNYSILSLPKTCYNAGKVNFYLKNYSSLKEIFVNGLQKKFYSIIEYDDSFFLLFHSNFSKNPIKIYVSNSVEECNNKLIEILKKLKTINRLNEGFYMIEHILLRPIDNLSFLINVENEKGQIVFKSEADTNYKLLVNMRDSLIDLMKDSSNYSVHSDINKKLIKISVFDTVDKKLLKSVKSYKSIEQAKKIVNQFCKNISNYKINIVSQNKYYNQFPDNFNYENEISFIFPEWPSRFQNLEFKKYINDVIDEYVPANIKTNLFFIDYLQNKSFLEIFNVWKNLKSKKPNSKLDLVSLELIQFILNQNND